MLLATLVNLLLIGCLGTWFLWWRRASRHIETFRQARLDMGELVTQLHTQLATAQNEIATVTGAARATMPELERTTAAAAALRAELVSVIAIGEGVADRIEAAARLARAAVTGPANEPAVREAPLPETLKSRPDALAMASQDAISASANPARKPVRGQAVAAAGGQAILRPGPNETI
jgi:hypothetical protein